jgi:hypothetical protein
MGVGGGAGAGNCYLHHDEKKLDTSTLAFEKQAL